MTENLVTENAAAASEVDQISFDLVTTRGFEAWLHENRISIAFSTYQFRRIFFVGLDNRNKVSVTHGEIGRCLGFALSGADLWASSESGIYCYRDMLADRQGPAGQGREALYVPRMRYFTGDLDIHDVAVNKQGGVVFVNTQFNCLATLSLTHSFRPLWKPSFISRLTPEDRCHLNGVALVDGRPKYVTCVSQSDTFDGWRDHRTDGGIVVDVASNEIVCSGLSMPHSPRWHAGQLWVLNSGTGEFGSVDFATRSFRPLCFLPGYARGLAFVNERVAIVGLSRPREKVAFYGLPLDAELQRRNIAARCGFYAVDLQSGHIVHSAVMEGPSIEVYEVGAVSGVRAARMVPLQGEEQKRTITIEQPI